MAGLFRRPSRGRRHKEREINSSNSPTRVNSSGTPFFRRTGFVYSSVENTISYHDTTTSHHQATQQSVFQRTVCCCKKQQEFDNNCAEGERERDESGNFAQTRFVYGYRCSMLLRSHLFFALLRVRIRSSRAAVNKPLRWCLWRDKMRRKKGELCLFQTISPSSSTFNLFLFFLYSTKLSESMNLFKNCCKSPEHSNCDLRKIFHKDTLPLVPFFISFFFQELFLVFFRIK